MASFNTTKRTGSSSSKYIYCICNYTFTGGFTETTSRIAVSNLQLYRTVGWKDSFTYRYYTSGTLQSGDSNINNQTSVSDKQYTGAGTTNVLGAQTKDFKRTKTPYNKVLNAYFITHSTTYSGSVTLTIPARNSHTISYNANGGTGKIASQTKFYSNSGETDYYETLSDGSGFTNSGYELVGWNTQPDGSGTSYSLSEVYTANGTTGITLYAQWISSVRVKADGAWHKGELSVKVSGAWTSGTLYKKVNGNWVQ